MPVKTSRRQGHQHLIDFGDFVVGDPTEGQVLTFQNGRIVWADSAGGSVDWPDIGGDQSLVGVAGFTNDAGFIASETDPVFGASPAASITSTQIGNYDTAFSWGNHATQGYLTAEVNDLTAAVTWANVPDANITQSSVVQHEDALSIDANNIVANNTPTDGQVLSFDATSGALLWVDPQIVSGALALTSISPTTGAQGDTITATGTFDTGQSISFTVGGTAATSPTVVDSTTATFVVPAGSGAGNDVVATQGSESDTLAGAFGYVSATSFAILDPARTGSNVTIKADDVSATNNSTNDSLAEHSASDAVNATGKLYAEILVVSDPGSTSSDLSVGITNESALPGSDWLGETNNSLGVWDSGIFFNGSSLSSDTISQNDVIGIAVDTATGQVWRSRNGTFIGDPGAGTGELAIITATDWHLAINPWGIGQEAKIITDPADMTHSAPSGFTAGWPK